LHFIGAKSAYQNVITALNIVNKLKRNSYKVFMDDVIKKLLDESDKGDIVICIIKQ